MNISNLKDTASLGEASDTTELFERKELVMCLVGPTEVCIRKKMQYFITTYVTY